MQSLDSIIEWLLTGDVSLQFQTQRDLLEVKSQTIEILQNRIEFEGFGSQFLACQNKDYSWGRGYYQPKWTSSHYTLLDLKYLNISPNVEKIKKAIDLIIQTSKGSDGGINPSGTISQSDVCINGMFLNFACYFGVDKEPLVSIIDFIIGQQMEDGGFNCRSNRSGATHSSLHTTLSVLEGINEYRINNYTHRIEELSLIEEKAIEFILDHRLFKSDKTGEVIDKKMCQLSYPTRWRYDILKALDYFQKVNRPYDFRMDDALALLISKRQQDGRWKSQNKHPGEVHFEMEIAGKPSMWNTLRALRVLKKYE